MYSIVFAYFVSYVTTWMGDVLFCDITIIVILIV